MPATITPIQVTRTYAVKPAQGLRYGNFDGVRNLPPIQGSERIEKENLCMMNNDQICRRICQWMETWQSWQTKTLLCGIANRFTLGQLEILATTLEPLRHRDYKTSTLNRYPSASFKIRYLPLPKKKKKLHGSKSERTVASVKRLSAVAHSTPGHGSQEVEKENSLENKRKLSCGSSPCIQVSYQRDENNNSNDQGKQKSTECESHTGYINDAKKATNIDDFASKLSQSVLTCAIKEANSAIFYDRMQFLSSTDKLCFDGKNKKAESESVLRESDHKRSMMGNDAGKLEKEKSETFVGENTRIDNIGEDTQDGSKSSAFETNFPKSATSGNKSCLASSRNSSSKFLGGVLEFATDILQKDLIRERSTSSSYRYSTFASSAVSTQDFFNQEKISVLGAMQKPFQPGLAQPTVGVDLAPISLQKCYKHSKWWPAPAPPGKTFQPPQKDELANNFKEQLQAIWDWLNEWEGHERISFMNEILKVCSADVLDYLMTHIHQRSWLKIIATTCNLAGRQLPASHPLPLKNKPLFSPFAETAKNNQNSQKAN